MAAKKTTKPAKRKAPAKKAIETKKERGRPSDYRRAHCETVVACGRDGMGRAEIAAALGITRETLGQWEKARPEFSDAMQRAHDLALAWWETQGRLGIWTRPGGKSLNAAAYSLQMRNRFRDDYGAPDAADTVGADLADAFTRSIARLVTRASAGPGDGEAQ